MTHFIIYGKKDCPYCTDVVEACLSMKDVCTYNYMDIEENPKVLANFKEKHTTVPQVYVELPEGYELIGDSKEFAAYVTEHLL